MNDAQRKAVWAEITDPADACREIAKHSSFLGGDPYYNDLVAALVEMCERAAEHDRLRAVARVATLKEPSNWIPVGDE